MKSSAIAEKKVVWKQKLPAQHLHRILLERIKERRKLYSYPTRIIR